MSLHVYDFDMSKLFRWLRLLLVGSLALPALPSCDGQRSTQALGSGGGRLRVLATVGMIGDIASRIAGSHAQVESLMGPGVDPHLYKPSFSDVRRIEEADLILYNGLNLEGKMGDVLEKSSRKRRVLAVSRDIPKSELRTPPEFQGHHDPHIWFDVQLWSRIVDPIAGELASLDPAHAQEFQRNAEALKADLATFDAEVARRIDTIPLEQRVLVTAHDAFGYFGRRYKIDVVGLQGISTSAEFTIRDVDRLVDVIVARKVKAVFVESSVPRRNIEAVQKACEARGHAVVIGGELFSDAMGAAGTPEGTYRGMIEHNVNAIVKALQ